MKCTAFMLILALGCMPDTIFCQTPDTTKQFYIKIFDEVENATRMHRLLWGKDIYAPLLLVNPENRKVFANRQDSAGTLHKEGNIYTGTLPSNVNIANTAIHWMGTSWAMVILPLPENAKDRINLITHELFHRAQHELLFYPTDPINNHLDQKDGRTLLRLELAALLKALHASRLRDRTTYITDAVTFRKSRYSHYPGADTLENELELNEGLAEYTGVLMSGRNKQQMIDHFDKSINNFLRNPSFVRSFAYQTIPIYGYILNTIDPGWNRQITNKTNLTSFFIKGFKLVIPDNLNNAVESKFNAYNAALIINEETARADSMAKLKSSYREKFILQAHTEIHFEKMNISFDPRNIFPLGPEGTIYPNIRISDNWGILTVTQGALMSPNWDKISFGLPQTFTAETVTGSGWELQLKKGYTLEKITSGNYILRKE